MILDSSAIVAIVLREPGFDELLSVLRRQDVLAVGAPTLVEAGIVLQARLGTDAQPILDRLLRDLEVTVLSFGEEQWREAIDAFRRYGRGRHRAALNFGDCLSYASATTAGQPLAYVGDDFSATDVSR